MKYYVKNQTISCRKEDTGEALLFDPDTNTIKIINITGLLIWDFLDRPKTIPEISHYLRDVCDNVPVDEISGDVEQCIQAFLAGDFVQGVN